MSDKKSGGLLSALRKVGLVEIQEDEPVSAPETAPVEIDTSQIQTGGASESLGEVVEQRPLDTIYASAGVPDSPFSAERVLKILGGLRAMDSNTQRAAVMAMDAADDAWTIEDVLLDAARKTQALNDYKKTLSAQAAAASNAAREAIEARNRKQQDATAAIRQQIADLQAMLEREIATATNDKKNAEAASRAALESAQRESQRIDQEIARLSEIPVLFSAPLSAR